jgi:hypothetical protein
MADYGGSGEQLLKFKVLVFNLFLEALVALVFHEREWDALCFGCRSDDRAARGVLCFAQSLGSAEWRCASITAQSGKQVCVNSV